MCLSTLQKHVLLTTQTNLNDEWKSPIKVYKITEVKNCRKNKHYWDAFVHRGGGASLNCQTNTCQNNTCQNNTWPRPDWRHNRKGGFWVLHAERVWCSLRWFRREFQRAAAQKALFFPWSSVLTLTLLMVGWGAGCSRSEGRGGCCGAVGGLWGGRWGHLGIGSLEGEHGCYVVNAWMCISAWAEVRAGRGVRGCCGDAERIFYRCSWCGSQS